MSNHSDDLNEAVKMRELMKQLGLGATGMFPNGMLTEHDQGEIKIAVTTKDNVVIIAFGKEISWIGFPPKQAIELGELLISKAKEIGGD